MARVVNVLLVKKTDTCLGCALYSDSIDPMQCASVFAQMACVERTWRDEERIVHVCSMVESNFR